MIALGTSGVSGVFTPEDPISSLSETHECNASASLIAADPSSLSAQERRRSTKVEPVMVGAGNGDASTRETGGRIPGNVGQNSGTAAGGHHGDTLQRDLAHGREEWPGPHDPLGGDDEWDDMEIQMAVSASLALQGPGERGLLHPPGDDSDELRPLHLGESTSGSAEPSSEENDNETMSDDEEDDEDEDEDDDDECACSMARSDDLQPPHERWDKDIDEMLALGRRRRREEAERERRERREGQAEGSQVPGRAGDLADNHCSAGESDGSDTADHFRVSGDRSSREGGMGGEEGGYTCF